MYPVDKIPEDQIVDTNGAGDMFAGGFVAALASGKSLGEAVQVGHKLGAMCITQVGLLCYTQSQPVEFLDHRLGLN